jgi:uncharacterized alpha-E superfamily protein
LIRLLRAVVLRLAGDTGSTTTMNAAALAEKLLLPLEHVTAEAIACARAGDDAALVDQVDTLIFGTEISGLQRLLRRVARTAWAARDRLSLDTWRSIYALTTRHTPEEPPGTFDGAGALAYLDTLIRRSAALSGLADENMTRGNNWLFFDLGRRIERTLSACEIVRRTLAVADERESGAIQVALEIADSVMTYSYRYRNAFQAAPAIDLLLLDTSNPRAVAFQIREIAQHAAELPLITDAQQRGQALAIAERIRARVTAADAYALADMNEHRERRALIALLDDVETAMQNIANAVGDAYLQHRRRFRA